MIEKTEIDVNLRMLFLDDLFEKFKKSIVYLPPSLAIHFSQPVTDLLSASLEQFEMAKKYNKI